MIVINLLKISNDKKTMDVSISTSVGETIQSVNLWTDKTFKDYNTAIDFSSKLAQTSENEIFSIASTEVAGMAEFDGIFFLEFTTSDVAPPSQCNTCDGKVILGVVAEFGRFQNCLLAKVLKLSDCETNLFKQGGCESPESTNIINIKVILDAMKYSLQSGYYSETIKFKNKLDILCSTDCYMCDDFADPRHKSGLNYCTIDNTLILQ